MSSRIGKIQAAWSSTGSTLYAIVRNSIAEAWNVGGAAFESFNVANWSQYAVAMTEQGALSQFYVADLPAGAESYYTATVYEQAGVGPAVADTLVEIIRAAQLSDDVPHGGILGSGTATLALGGVDVTGASFGSLVNIHNNGVGGGMTVQADVSDALTLNAVARGLSIISSGSAGIDVAADGAPCIQLRTTNGNFSAITATGSGTAPAIKIGDGILGSEGLMVLAGGEGGNVSAVSLLNTSNFGPVVQIGDGSAGAEAVKLVAGSGLGAGSSAILAIGAGTGPAVQFGDGTSGGIGLEILAGIGSGTGAAGVNIAGNLQGDGVDITGGATDATGLLIAKGGTLGNALEISGGQHAILLETINSSVILANGNNTFMTANLVGGDEYLRVNSVVSIDNVGRHRILSSLTNDDALLAFPFLMTDLAGNPMTGLTVTSTVIIDGAAPVPTVNSPVEIGNGVYAIDLDASDRAGTTMMLRFTAPNARDLDIAIINTA